MFASSFSAKDERTIRRNAVIMPLYQLPIVLVFFVGFTAFLVIPGLKNPDTALLALVTKSYPAWFAGFVGAAGAVTAMVPAGVLLLSASTLMAKNVYRPLRRTPVDEAHLMKVSRVMMVFIAVIALGLALWSPAELVNLLIFGYDGVSQFFPALVLGLFVGGIGARPVASGLVAGEIVVVSLIWSHHDPFLGLNAGFVGLAVNTMVTMAGVLVSRSPWRKQPAAVRRVA
jgi:SSS family solute:Na+ symporter